MIMSGYDFLKSQVLSCRRKVESVCDVVISSGRVFQTRGPATVNARSPTVERLTKIFFFSWSSASSVRWSPSIAVVLIILDIGIAAAAAVSKFCDRYYQSTSSVIINWGGAAFGGNVSLQFSPTMTICHQCRTASVMYCTNRLALRLRLQGVGWVCTMLSTVGCKMYLPLERET